MHQHQAQISGGFGCVRVFGMPSPWNVQIVSQKQHFMMQAFLMFVLMCVLTWFTHYYIGKYTIIKACVNVNINVFMYSIYFPSDNANSSMCRYFRGKCKSLHWLYICVFLSSVQDNQAPWHSMLPYSIKMKSEYQSFLKLLFSQFLQNWNQKCSIKGLISHWSLTRFTREFCLIDDQDYACLHMSNIL